MSTIINFSRTPLPSTQFEGDIDDFIDLIVAHLEGTLENGAITGQVGGSEPISDIGGFWFNEVFYTWNELAGKYLPIPLLAGRVYNDVLYTTFLQSSATADRTLTLPDKNGTLATIDEVINKNDTETPVASPITLDYTKNAYYYVVLAADTTFHDNMADGCRIDLWVENSQNNGFDVFFPGIIFMGTVPPVQTAGTSTQRALDHYILYRVDGITFGEHIANGLILAPLSGGDNTGPVAVTFFGAVDTITITCNESIRGGSLTTSDFVVKKNNNVQSISSASANGNKITIDLAVSFLKADVIQVQYLNVAHTVKDLAGNPMLAFGLHAVVNGTNATGNGAGGFSGQNGPHGAIP